MSQQDLDEIMKAIEVLRQADEAGYTALLSESDIQEAMYYVKTRYKNLDEFEKGQLSVYYDIISKYV